MTSPAEVVDIGGGDLDSLLERARRLLAVPGRTLLGITGPPGAGKSALAAHVVSNLGPVAALVPMDGFHLSQAELSRLGRTGRKGAPDTFDAHGFVALARRLKAAADDVVYAPEFRRDIDEPVAGSVAVSRRASLVVTEGNYLLLEAAPWGQLRGLLDEVWYLAPDEGVRLVRLTRRHVDYGRDRETARRRAEGADQRNADLIAATRDRADVVITGVLRLPEVTAAG